MLLKESFETITDLTGRRLKITVITPGQGSSGYYPAEVIAQAVNLIGQPGSPTPMYINHATDAERWERPEGDLEALAGVISSPPTVNPVTGALEAEAKVFESHRQFILDRKDIIGVSINGSAVKDGDTVKEITRIDSVDFVTKAGRGGKIDAVLESATHQKEESKNMADTNQPVEDLNEVEEREVEACAEADSTKQKPAAAAPNKLTAPTSAEDKDAEIERLKKEIEALKAELAKTQESAKRAQVEAAVEAAFTGIDAPRAKARLIEAGMRTELSVFESELTESVKEFTPVSPVKDMGGDRLTEAAAPAYTPTDVLKELRGA